MPPLNSATDTIMTIGQLVKQHFELPLQHLKAWSDKVPFKMDALGLVTLLGADEVSTAVGSLQRRRYTGALPLLAAFVLAGDRFTSIQPGFVAHNLTDEITSADMAGWFTRWLMSQSTNNATTTFQWKPRQRSAEPWWERIFALVISCLLVVPLVICTVLMGDWYGVANASAIVISIVARLHILRQRRQARDRMMRGYGHHQTLDNIRTLLITRSDGKMVTVFAPLSTIPGFIGNASMEVKHRSYYAFAQQAAWVALGTHLLVLGMCTLVTQIYTVILLVASTIAVSSTTDWSADTQHKTASLPGDQHFSAVITTIPFNDDWDVIKTIPASRVLSPDGDLTKMDRRQVAWARLLLTKRQEAFMRKLRLMPEEDNRAWWDAYTELRGEYELGPPRDQPPLRASTLSSLMTGRPLSVVSMQPSVPFPATLPPGTSGTAFRSESPYSEPST